MRDSKMKSSQILSNFTCETAMFIKNQIGNMFGFGRNQQPAKAEQPVGDPFEEFEAISKEIYIATSAEAHAAAADGTGPQIYDGDWWENTLDPCEEVEAMVHRWSWQNVQIFQEILDMALASPQGQKAQSIADEEHNPWEDSLAMIEQMRSAITFRSHRLLLEQGKGLGNSQGRQFELQLALEDLLDPEES